MLAEGDEPVHEPRVRLLCRSCQRSASWLVGFEVLALLGAIVFSYLITSCVSSTKFTAGGKHAMFQLIWFRAEVVGLIKL
jgi:hypothetical protein